MSKWFDDVLADLEADHADLDASLAELSVIRRLAEHIEATGAPKDGGSWGAGGDTNSTDTETKYADEELGRLIGVDPRTINPALAWLEEHGHLIRVVDQCSSHGSIKMFDISDPQIRETLNNL
jgi:hypothetical protein